LKKVLQNIANRENLHVPNSILENIIDNSNGDIRIAINSLQFQSVAGTPSSQPVPKKRKNRKGEVIVDFNRHMGHLSLFHAVGKVLYAKKNVNGTLESSPEVTKNYINIPQHKLLFFY
jgi:DNA polymerase III delta prime subunit